MEYIKFIRRPFVVEAVQITKENIEELSKIVGELKYKGNTPYIALDRRLVPNVTRAYVGWWLTRLEDNVRCYSPKVFLEQFTQYNGESMFIVEDNTNESSSVPSSEAFDVV